ncbi:MAG: nucleotidyltransferase family protein [Pseudomonadota bacterium]
MTTPRSAMILAAGYGTRMGALTADRPKPLISVAGQTLIDRTLDLVAKAGIPEAVVNLHYHGEMIRAHLATRSAPSIRYSEEPDLLDTGGGLVAARGLLQGPVVAVANSDAVFAGPNPLTVLAASGLPAGAKACLLMVEHTGARGYTRQGDFFADGMGLQRRGDADHAPLIYTGVQLLGLDALDGAPAGAFSTNLIWNRLIAEGAIAHAVYPGLWVDVGTPDGIREAEATLAEASE